MHTGGLPASLSFKSRLNAIFSARRRHLQLRNYNGSQFIAIGKLNSDVTGLSKSYWLYLFVVGTYCPLYTASHTVPPTVTPRTAWFLTWMIFRFWSRSIRTPSMTDVVNLVTSALSSTFFAVNGYIQRDSFSDQDPGSLKIVCDSPCRIAWMKPESSVQKFLLKAFFFVQKHAPVNCTCKWAPIYVQYVIAVLQLCWRLSRC